MTATTSKKDVTTAAPEVRIPLHQAVAASVADACEVPVSAKRDPRPGSSYSSMRIRKGIDGFSQANKVGLTFKGIGRKGRTVLRKSLTTIEVLDIRGRPMKILLEERPYGDQLVIDVNQHGQYGKTPAEQHRKIFQMSTVLTNLIRATEREVLPAMATVAPTATQQTTH